MEELGIYIVDAAEDFGDGHGEVLEPNDLGNDSYSCIPA
jgi:hypothetical protein